MKRMEIDRLIARRETKPRFQLRLSGAESEKATGDLGTRARISAMRRGKKVTLPPLKFQDDDVTGRRR
jgi:hypothetical protein